MCEFTNQNIQLCVYHYVYIPIVISTHLFK
jgi:hypothetical protein